VKKSGHDVRLQIKCSELVRSIRYHLAHDLRRRRLVARYHPGTALGRLAARHMGTRRYEASFRATIRSSWGCVTRPTHSTVFTSWPFSSRCGYGPPVLNSSRMYCRTGAGLEVPWHSKVRPARFLVELDADARVSGT